MKYFALVLCLLIVSCKNTTPKETIDLTTYKNFGEAFQLNEGVLDADALSNLYQNLSDKDTLEVVVKSPITAVCQTKGCWMTLPLKNNQESFIKFKDYAFFVPLNAAGSVAIVKGKAYKKVTTVEALKHYAEDAGKSEDEINNITEPEETLAFMADGVYLKKSESKKE